MKSQTVAGLACIAMLLLAACSSEPTSTGSLGLERAPQESTTRNISQGEVIGTFGAEGSLAWYGIPYAAPPVGDLRWRAPRPIDPWTDQFQALEPDRRCVQYAAPYEPQYEDWTLLGDEDCLYLNVWAPAEQSDEPLPVMVYIHGGAGVWGHAGKFELGQFASRTNTVVVSINYRLAMMGWFAHPDIIDAAETDLDQSVNFALLDQIAALDWIQQNIDTFGGDSENVTVFGQSAGGFQIAALLSSPLTEGLFHKAIIQSGGFNDVPLDDVMGQTSNADAPSGTIVKDFIDALNERDPSLLAEQSSNGSYADALRALPVGLIFDVYKEMPTDREMTGLVNPAGNAADGVSIPKNGVREALISGQMRDVPLLIGTNRDEIKGLSFQDPDLVSNLFGVKFWPKDRDVYDAVGYYPNAAWANFGVREPAEIWAATNNSPVFTYRFDWDEQGKHFTTDIGFMVGASHSLEMAFVIDGFDQSVTDAKGIAFKKGNAKGREELSAKMMEYWAAFAHNDTPGTGLSGNLTEWRAFAPDSESLLLLDTEKGGGVRMSAPTPTGTDLYKQFLDDTRFQSIEQRCKSANPVLEAIGTVGGDISSWSKFVKENC